MSASTVTDRTAPTVVPAGAPPLRASRLPSSLRLSILFVINFSISSLLLSYVPEYFGPQLGAISKAPEDADLRTPILRLGYKMGVIWAGWWLSYDFLDISALTVITNMPYAYLLSTYYNITLPTVGAIVAIDVLAIAIPTYLLRPRSAVNNPNVPLRGRYLLNSSQVNVSNILLAVAVYVVAVLISLKSGWYRGLLVNRFALETMEIASAETTFSLAPKLLLVAMATKHFLLNPSLGATPTRGEVTPVEAFDPATATLSQTLKHNFWFYSRRTRTLIQQTAIASLFILANTVQRCLSLRNQTVRGVELSTIEGAVVYSTVWILANILCALWWIWVADAEL